MNLYNLIFQMVKLLYKLYYKFILYKLYTLIPFLTHPPPHECTLTGQGSRVYPNNRGSQVYPNLLGSRVCPNNQGGRVYPNSRDSW